MKKQYIFLLLLCLCSSIIFAQVSKGKWLISGTSNLGLDIGKTKWESSGSSPTTEYKYSQFNFSPEAAYFIINKLAVGLFMDFEFDKNKTTDGDDAWKSNSFIIGPLAKYYILDYKNLWPYVGIGMGFGAGKTVWGDSDPEKFKMFTYRFGGGATYFLNENVGFDLFLGYNKDISRYDRSGGYKSTNSSDTEDDIYSSLKTNIGIVVSFGK